MLEIESIDIKPSTHVSVGDTVQIIWTVNNTGTGIEPAHYDHIQVWRSDGVQPLDTWSDCEELTAGMTYMNIVEAPGLDSGFYDVMITLPNGSGKGGSFQVG
jgi:hypothetical protein